MTQKYDFPDSVLFFRVEPESRNHYFHCYVWPYLKQMREYIRQVSSVNPRRAHAVTLDYTQYHRGLVPKGLLGEIHLAKRELTDDFISHECTHATLIWARWRRIPGAEVFDGTSKDGEHEERIAYALGAMCYQITATLKKYKYKE